MRIILAQLLSAFNLSGLAAAVGWSIIAQEIVDKWILIEFYVADASR